MAWMSAARSRSQGIPPLLRPLFWDYPGGRISLSGDRSLVLRRVLSIGGWRQARFLRARLGDEGIRDFLLASEARGLSPARIRFWQLVLGLPKRRADAWVRTARASSWERRGAP